MTKKVSSLIWNTISKSYPFTHVFLLNLFFEFMVLLGFTGLGKFMPYGEPALYQYKRITKSFMGQQFVCLVVKHVIKANIFSNISINSILLCIPFETSFKFVYFFSSYHCLCMLYHQLLFPILISSQHGPVTQLETLSICWSVGPLVYQFILLFLGSGPKRLMSYRTQGWISRYLSIHPSVPPLKLLKPQIPIE